ncbi:MAG: hypothetical protein N2167_01135 [Flavobacteriales bacterium]|nr:hypothetical protein [Flavobacteriales bacterium]
MTTAALITMITVQALVTIISGYFFWKILTAKPKPEPDSYSEE